MALSKDPVPSGCWAADGWCRVNSALQQFKVGLEKAGEIAKRKVAEKR